MVQYRTKKELSVYDGEGKIVAVLPPGTDVNIEAFEPVGDKQIRGFINNPHVGYCQMANIEIRQLLNPISPNVEAPFIRPNYSRADSERSRSRSISISEESKSLSKSPLPPGVHIDIDDGFVDTRNRSPAIGEEGLSPLERCSNLSQSAPNVQKDILDIDEKDDIPFPRSLEDGMKSLNIIQDRDFQSSSSFHIQEQNYRSGSSMMLSGISERAYTVGSVTPSVLDISMLNSDELGKHTRRAKTTSTVNRNRKGKIDNYKASLAKNARFSESSTQLRTTKAVSMVMGQRGKPEGKRGGKQYLQVGIKVSGKKKEGHTFVAVDDSTTVEEVVQFIYKRRKLELPIDHYALSVTYSNSSLTNCKLLAPDHEPVRVLSVLSRKYPIDVHFDFILKSANREKNQGSMTSHIEKSNEQEVRGHLECRWKFKNNWKILFWVFNGANRKGKMRGFNSKSRFENKKKPTHEINIDNTCALLVLPRWVVDDQMRVTTADLFLFNIQTGKHTWQFRAKTFHDMGLWIKAIRKTCYNTLNHELDQLSLEIQRVQRSFSVQREHWLENYSRLELFLRVNAATDCFMNYLKDIPINAKRPSEYCDLFLKCYVHVNSYTILFNQMGVDDEEKASILANDIINSYLREGSNLQILVSSEISREIVENARYELTKDLFAPLQAYVLERLRLEFTGFQESLAFFDFINSANMSRNSAVRHLPGPIPSFPKPPLSLPKRPSSFPKPPKPPSLSLPKIPDELKKEMSPPELAPPRVPSTRPATTSSGFRLKLSSRISNKFKG